MSAKAETESEPDITALRRLLAYCEQECRRLGVEAAARHAAMAAALMAAPAREAATRH